jgi:hypothetical protein
MIYILTENDNDEGYIDCIKEDIARRVSAISSMFPKLSSCILKINLLCFIRNSLVILLGFMHKNTVILRGFFGKQD